MQPIQHASYGSASDRLIYTSRRKRADSSKNQAALEGRVGELERILQSRIESEEEAGKRKQQNRFIVMWAVIALVFTTPGLIASIVVSRVAAWKLSRVVILTEGLLLILWIWLADKFGTKNPLIAEWSIFVRFHRLKTFLFSVFGIGVLINATWDWIKQLW
jgi:hypothetical protein